MIFSIQELGKTAVLLVVETFEMYRDMMNISRATELLRIGSGNPEANFRNGQQRLSLILLAEKIVCLLYKKQDGGKVLFISLPQNYYVNRAWDPLY